MASGSEHYREAERLLADVADMDPNDVERRPTWAHFLIARATAHFAAAHAAATALGLSDGGGAGMRSADAEAWERVASVLPVDVDEDGELHVPDGPA